MTPSLCTSGVDVGATERVVEEGPSEPNGGLLESSATSRDCFNVSVVEDSDEESPREESAGDRLPSAPQVGVEERIVYMLQSSMGAAETNGIGGDQEVERNRGPARSYTTTATSVAAVTAPTTASMVSTTTTTIMAVTTTRRGVKRVREELTDDESEGRRDKRTR